MWLLHDLRLRRLHAGHDRGELLLGVHRGVAGRLAPGSCAKTTPSARSDAAATLPAARVIRAGFLMTTPPCAERTRGGAALFPPGLKPGLGCYLRRSFLGRSVENGKTRSSESGGAGAWTGSTASRSPSPATRRPPKTSCRRPTPGPGRPPPRGSGREPARSGCSTILHNVWRNQVRRRRPDGAVEDRRALLRGWPTPGAGPSSPLRGRRRAAAVREAIEALPESFREVVMLRCVGGFSYKDVAGDRRLPRRDGHEPAGPRPRCCAAPEAELSNPRRGGIMSCDGFRSLVTARTWTASSRERSGDGLRSPRGPVRHLPACLAEEREVVEAVGSSLPLYVAPALRHRVNTLVESRPTRRLAGFLARARRRPGRGASWRRRSGCPDRRGAAPGTGGRIAVRLARRGTHLRYTRASSRWRWLRNGPRWSPAGSRAACPSV